MLIISGAVLIISFNSRNMTHAKETKIKSDLSVLDQELKQFDAGKKIDYATNNSNFNISKLDIGVNGKVFYGDKEEKGISIENVLPSLAQTSLSSRVFIVSGQIYIDNRDGGLNDEQKQWIQQLNYTVIDENILKFNTNNLNLKVGQTYEVTVKEFPELKIIENSDSSLSFLSDKTEVATVSLGVIRGIGKGNAEITVSKTDYDSDTLKVAVGQTSEVQVADDTTEVLLPNSISLRKGEVKEISADLLPAGTSNNINWSANNTKVTITPNGSTVSILANEEGNSIVTAKTDNGKIANTTITVTHPLELDVTLASILSNQIALSISANTTYGNIEKIDVLYKKKSDNEYEQQTITIGSNNYENHQYVINGLDQETAYDIEVIATLTDGEYKKVDLECTTSLVEVSSVSLSKTSASIKKGKTTKLTATVLPENVTDKSVTWTSSNTSIATVAQDGTVTGTGIGKATITATSNSDNTKYATCKVTVTNPISISASSVGVTDTVLKIKISTSTTYGTISTVKVKVKEHGATTYIKDETVNVGKTSYKNNSYTVSGLTPNTEYDVVVTSIGSDGSSKTVNINMTTAYVDVTSVSLNKTSISMKKGESDQLTATVSPANATNKSVTWTSSNESIVTVDEEGNIIGEDIGTATITATSNADNTKYATCSVTITNPVTLDVSGSDSSENSLTFDIYSSTTYEDLDRIEYSVKTLGNNEVYRDAIENIKSNEYEDRITVNSELNAGQTYVIYVISYGIDGNYAEDSIEMTTDYTEVTSVSLNKTTVSMKKGESDQLTATVLPVNATDKSVTWTSSNTSIATVSQDGTVTGTGLGTATITATSNADNTKYATCSVTVTNPVTILANSVSVTETSLTFKISTSTTYGTISKVNVKVKKHGTTTYIKDEVVNVGKTSYANDSYTVNGLTANTQYDIVITSTGSDNSSATANLDMTTQYIYVESISINPTELTIVEGNTASIEEVEILPTNATNKNYSFDVSDDQIIEVDSNGVITAKKPGNANVIVIGGVDKNGSDVEAICKVTVTKAVAKIGTTNYDNLQSAFDATSTTENSPTTITLLNNINANTLSKSTENPNTAILESGRYAKLDIDGYNIENNVSNKYTIVNNGDLSIFSGSAPSYIDNSAYHTINNNGKLSISSIGIKNTSSNGNYIAIYCNSSLAEVVQNYGSITSTSYYGMYLGSAKFIQNSGRVEGTVGMFMTTGTATIKGTVIGNTTRGVYISGSGTITVDDGTINGETDGIYSGSSSSNITVNDGKIISNKNSGISSYGTVNVKGGEVTGIYISSSGTLNLGTKEDSVTEDSVTESPIITNKKDNGYEYGVYNNGGTFYFYDGIISSGNTSKEAIVGSVTGTQSGYLVEKRVDSGKNYAILTKYTPVTSVSIYSTLNVVAGNTVNLTATVSPSNASDKTVSWKSSDTSVATVSSGLIKGVSEGTATITVTTNGKQADGNFIGEPITATCTVTVTKAVARIGTTNYDNLQSAFDAVTGTTPSSRTMIDVVDNIDDDTLSSTSTKTAILNTGKYASLNLGQNHTITTSSTSNYTIQNKGNLEIYGYSSSSIKNSKYHTLKNDGILSIGSGNIVNDTTSNAIYNTNELCVEDGKISSSSSAAVYCTNNNAKVEQYGGEIVSSSSYGVNVSTGTFEQYGGYVEGSNGMYITTGTATINGTVTGKITRGGYISSSGIVNIDGGTITGETDGIYLDSTSSNINVNDGNIISRNNSGISSKGTINLKGGEVTGIYVSSTGILNLGTDDGSVSTESPKVTNKKDGDNGVVNDGGTFNFYDGVIYSKNTSTSAINGNVTDTPDGYMVFTTNDTLDGKQVEKAYLISDEYLAYNKDTDTFYNSISNAISEADNEQNIYLLKDYYNTVSINISTKKTVYFDLNGHKISAGVNSSYYGGTITIGTSNSNLKLVIRGNKPGSLIENPKGGQAVALKGGDSRAELVIESGTIKGMVYAYKLADVTLKGGKIESIENGIELHTGSRLVIEGGEIYSNINAIVVAESNYRSDSLTIKGGVIKGDNNAIYLIEEIPVDISNATIEGDINGVYYGIDITDSYINGRIYTLGNVTLNGDTIIYYSSNGGYGISNENASSEIDIKMYGNSLIAAPYAIQPKNRNVNLYMYDNSKIYGEFGSGTGSHTVNKKTSMAGRKYNFSDYNP